MSPATLCPEVKRVDSQARIPPQVRITCVILARNEEQKIPDAIRSVREWCMQVIVVDDSSTDRTAEIAGQFGCRVIPVGPRPDGPFDGLRSLALPHVIGDYVLFLDADERVMPRLADEIVRLVTEEAHTFEALLMPFLHVFCGKVMEHSGWGQGGYTRPQLLKKGCFTYSPRIHGGVEVNGRIRRLPADPERSILHLSYDNLSHYLSKLNAYTTAGSADLVESGAACGWKAQLAHLLHDWTVYYDRGAAYLDGTHGFVLAMLSADYRFIERAKTWDRRREQGDLLTDEPLPRSIGEILRFLLQVYEAGPAAYLQQLDDAGKTGSGCALSAPRPQAAPKRGEATPSPTQIRALPYSLVFEAPLLHGSGYGDEARQTFLGLVDAGVDLRALPIFWGQEACGNQERTTINRRRLTLEEAERGGAEILIRQTLPALQGPRAWAGFNIARTMWETDRLPQELVERIDSMDRIWVPSEFNRRTFIESGVPPEKLAVIPGALDTERFAAADGPEYHAPAGLPERGRFTFLSVFDWSRHKGWDVLLEAFHREFAGEPDIRLHIKTWSSSGLDLDGIHVQASHFLHKRFGCAALPENLLIFQQQVEVEQMPAFYRTADCFVLPTRGEGWCRPLMEAMAVGLPTIATAWSGLTAFHDAEVGYPLDYERVRVPDDAASELPLFAGQRWAEPDVDHLRRLMRQVVEDQEGARRRGAAARERVLRDYSRAGVAGLVIEELSRLSSSEACSAGAAPGDRGNLGAVDGDQRAPGAGPAPDAPTVQTRPTPQDERAGDLPPDHAGDPGSKERSAAAVGADGRTPFPTPHPASILTGRGEDLRALRHRPLRVRWEGPMTLVSSLAKVNRELCRRLLGGDVELSWTEPRTNWSKLTARDDGRLAELLSLEERPLSGAPDVTIRHHFPPNWTRPSGGRLIVMQPWEYGYLPQSWVEGAQQADEIWAYSRFVRDTYVRSGVPAEKVRVVPLGFDPAVFHPAVELSPQRMRPYGDWGAGWAAVPNPQSAIHNPQSTRFLFVGGALDRKGADLLLRAYQAAFTAEDDVLLIVKDMGTTTFYPDNPLSEAFREAERGCQDRTAGVGPGLPRVAYLSRDMSEPELGALYRSATCLVLPYRGEGFALPPLEAMACGVMPIVTAGGPSDDYLDDSVALRLTAAKVSFGGRQVGSPELGLECVGNPWLLEPDLDALVSALRAVHADPRKAKAMGLRAWRRAQAWTWDAAVQVLRDRLAEVVAPVSPRASGPARFWQPGAA